MSYSGTVTCSWCYETGHNKRTCKMYKRYIENNPNSWTARYQKEREGFYRRRACSYCSHQGHNRRTCPFMASDKAFFIATAREARATLYKFLKSVGFGRGALIRDDWSEQLSLVEKIDWRCIDHRQLEDYEIFFDARRCDTGRVHTNGLTIQQISCRVVSSTPSSLILTPDGWSNGTLYDTDRWFGEKSRHWYFSENNPFSP